MILMFNIFFLFYKKKKNNQQYTPLQNLCSVFESFLCDHTEYQ